MTGNTLEQRARELLAAEYDAQCKPNIADMLRNGRNVDAGDSFALRAIEAALRLSAGADWPEPTDDMVEAGRTAVMALECSGPKWTVRQHYDASGDDPAGIPDELLDMVCPMPKSARAELIYRAMLAATTRHGPGEVKAVPIWTCRACGHRNTDAASEHCGKCGEYHPATIKVPV